MLGRWVICPRDTVNQCIILKIVGFLFITKLNHQLIYIKVWYPYVRLYISSDGLILWQTLMDELYEFTANIFALFAHFVEIIFQSRDLLNVWCTKLKSAIIQGLLLKSGVPPPKSSCEVITPSYPVQVFIDKSALKTVQFQNRNRVHIKIGTYFPGSSISNFHNKIGISWVHSYL